MDLITQLPPSIDRNGNTFTAIAVVADRFTKRAHFFACDDHFSTTDAADLIYDELIKLHGMPRQII